MHHNYIVQYVVDPTLLYLYNASFLRTQNFWRTIAGPLQVALVCRGSHIFHRYLWISLYELVSVLVDFQHGKNKEGFIYLSVILSACKVGN